MSYIVAFCISDEEMERKPGSPYDGASFATRFDESSVYDAIRAANSTAIALKRFLIDKTNYRRLTNA